MEKDLFSTLKKGDRLIVINGFIGGTMVVTVQTVHLDEELVMYLDKDGNESFALFEEVIKKL
jgi:preprotein translocase subunit YajC